MHVALLLEADPPGGDPRTDVAAVVARLELALEEIERRRTPLAVSVSGPALAAVRHQAGSLLDRLAGAVEWVRTVWDAPDLTTLPDRVVQAAIEHEISVWRAAGLTPGTLLVRGPWEPRLAGTLSSAGEHTILFDREHVRPHRQGIVHHLDSTLAVLPVAPVPETMIPDRSDDLVIWNVKDPALLRTTVDRIRALAFTAMTTPADYASSHSVTGRSAIRTPETREDPEATLLRCKLLRLATRMPERAPTSALEHLLEGASHEGLSPGASGALRRRMHEALIDARRNIDETKRRGDEWGRVRRLDWDADGTMEVQVELAGMSVVLDPERGGSLPVVDDKVRSWAAGFLAGEPPGTLVRLADTDGNPLTVSLDVEQVEEARGRVEVVLTGTTEGGGSLHCRLRAAGRVLRLRYRLEGCPAGRVGPELALALGRSRARADGAGWVVADRPTGLAGHRFRLDGGAAQVLAGSMMPTECFLRPHPDGIVAWLNWVTNGDGIYELELDLAPPESTARNAS